MKFEYAFRARDLVQSFAGRVAFRDIDVYATPVCSIGTDKGNVTRVKVTRVTRDALK